MMDEHDIPVKSPPNEQAEQALDPRTVGDNSNPSPDQLRIDPAQLFEQAMEQTRMAICITDPFQPDNPMVYVNQAYLELTGYAREEVLGRNCRLLQGKDTSPHAVAKIQQALSEKSVKVVDILNYTKDGTPFWNALHIGPIFDEAGRLTHYYGSQWNITELMAERERSVLRQQVAQELQHRTNNLFAVLGAIIRLTAREHADGGPLAAQLTERIQALARAHQASIAPGGAMGQAGDLRTLAEAVLQPYRSDVSGRIQLEGPAVELSSQIVTPLGLVLHEMATNALKYGALGDRDGKVRIAWRAEDGFFVVDWIESGVSMRTRPSRGSGTGSAMMDGILRSAHGHVTNDWRPEGLHATIRLPL